MKPVWETHLSVAVEVDETYHLSRRKEIASFFDEPPGVVVDVGCGAGATGRLLKEKFPGTPVIGIEINAAAAAAARQHLDAVVTGDLAQVRLAPHLAGRPIGVLLLLDVLEHLVDPWRALVTMRSWLAPESRVLASVPNIRNLQTLDHIAAGAFDYDIHGVLDVTHLRFFTRSTLRRLFEETGYEVVSMEPLVQPELDELVVERRPGSVSTRHVSVRCPTRESFDDLYALQYAVDARVAREGAALR
ncbi:MAG: methyltransferase domain-containing protein [Burkholderiales bacterium]|nr:methyltransferase domain-containing protein [Burkholderiales bacterium]MCC7114572.1 methyltransferase domain-containing protein [Burkholderiales bacterium]